MLSLEECKKYVGHLNLSDEEILEVRDSISELAGHLLDEGINNKNNDE